MRTEIQTLAQEAERTTIGKKRDAAGKTRDVLQSWKEIASELDRGVRTVQRWESSLALPVHRLGKGPRGPVFAFKDELQMWLRNQVNGDRATTGIPCHPSKPEFQELRDDLPVLGWPRGGRNESELDGGRLTKSSVRILQLISSFFRTNAPRHDRQNCNRCRRRMQFLEGHFWLYGTDMTWKLAMPICLSCDSEIAEHLHQEKRIH